MFDNYDAGIGEGRVTGIFVFDPPCEPPSLPVVSCRSARASALQYIKTRL